MKKTSPVSVLALALSFSVLVGVATTSSAAQADAPDGMAVTTLEVPAGNLDCSRTSSPWALDARAAVVRGRHHKIRIARHLVDVNLERASVESCNGECSAAILRKGNSDGKGFVELDLHVKGSAPAGNATLVLHYPLGMKGEYKLLVVANSRVDGVDRSTAGASAERYTVRGANLDVIQNHFSANRTGAGGFSLSRVNESDAALVLDRNERNCTDGAFELDLALEAAPSCRIRDVRIPASRDAACGSGGGGGSSSAPPQAPPSPPRTSTPRTPNLLPSVLTPTLLTRALTPAAGGMVRVNDAFCANLAANAFTSVPVPKLTWGVSGTNIEAANRRFDVQLLDADTGRVLDTLTLAQGFPASTPLVTKDNYPGRPATLRVIRDPRGSGGAQTGCFAEASAAASLDAKSLLVRVDPSNQINEGSRENDNDLRF